MVAAALGTAQVNEDLRTFRRQMARLRVHWDALQDESELLARERQRYVDFFDFAPDAYVVTSPDGTILEANRAAGELIQSRADVLIGKPLAVLVHASQRRAFREHFRALRAGACWPAQDRVRLCRPGRPGNEALIGVRPIGTPPSGFCWALTELA